MLSVVMLNVIYAECHNYIHFYKFGYAASHNTKCHNTEYRNAECHYVDCRYAECCRAGPKSPDVEIVKVSRLKLNSTKRKKNLKFFAKTTKNSFRL